MADSVLENIANEIVDRLTQIQIINGYSFDVAGVVRPQRKAITATPKNLSIQVVQSANRPNMERSHEGNPPALAFDVVFNLHCFVRLPDNEEDTYFTTINRMMAAIITAITTEATDPSMWYTLESNAVNCNWGPMTPFISPEGEHSGETIPIVVTYRISENDPTESRS